MTTDDTGASSSSADSERVGSPKTWSEWHMAKNALERQIEMLERASVNPSLPPQVREKFARRLPQMLEELTALLTGYPPEETGSD